MNDLEQVDKYNNKAFEEIKHIDENDNEFWYARELQIVLDYKEWRKFESTINKAIKSCEMLVLLCLNILSAPTKR